MTITASQYKALAARSKEWTGPNTWGWVDGYRLGLHKTIELPGFG